MGTFADLMALLMCFFVLLLSFSEMDVLKFKQIAGSMKFAFGVQNKIEVKDIPKGTSVIAMEFRPGRPEPTPIDTIQQQTTNMTQEMLEFQAGNEDSAGGRQKQRGEQRGGAAQQTASEQQSQSTAKKSNQEEVAERMRKVAQQLEKQIVDGAIEMESLGQQITIRIRENGSFSAGSAFLQPQFIPILRKIGVLLADIPGDIEVSGHSDSQQISNELYRSNWDLSSQRAVAVAEELRKAAGFDESRMSVVGKADTAPLTEGDEAVDRSRNRRVEISIKQGKSKISEPITVLE
jgi:chemotaxis protein MotB